MADSKFRVGAVFPQNEIECDAFVIRDFAQAVEELGFSHMVAADHVLGAGTKTRPDWNGPYNYQDPFHEPLTLFGYLAGLTKRLGLMTGVVILPQRQTALFGKQAANVDVFCGGRLRIGLGVGWNEVEYEALGVPFRNRGARLDDQIRFLRKLWTTETFSDETPFHKITDAGINPLPLQRPIPIWIGGQSEPAIRRAAALGDGWLPSGPVEDAAKFADNFFAEIERQGRDRTKIGFENMIIMGAVFGRKQRGPQEAAAEAEIWKKAGATGVSFHTKWMGAKRADQHLKVVRDLAAALGL